MAPSNRDIIEKADLAVSQLVSNGGYLNPMQANTFIRMIQEQPTIVSAIRTVPMSAPTMEINAIGFASRILKKAPASGSALAASDRSAPTTDKITLTTKEVIGEVHIPYDVLEDNIERGNLEDTILEMIAERASLDIEELVLLGDTTSLDTYLAQFNGILKLATSHVVDFTGSEPATIDKDVFKPGILAMPNKYLRNRRDMVFWVSPDTETEFADSIADRATTLGDTRYTQGYQNMLACFGVPVVSAPLMPDTNYVLTYPQNVVLGVQRQIMIESDRDIRARVLIVVLTMRLAVEIEREDAVVKAQDMVLTPA